jgi:hypothetical protein
MSGFDDPNESVQRDDIQWHNDYQEMEKNTKKLIDLCKKWNSSTAPKTS